MKTNELKGKKVLVTGGSGFFGSHLVKQLLNMDCEVFVMTRYDSIVDNIRLAGVWEKIKIIEADLRNSDSLMQLRDIKPQVIFHLAAYNHVGDSFLHINESLMVNTVGTANLMEAYQKYEKFIYIATSEVYGYQQNVPFVETMTPFPTSPYAVGKYGGELFAQMKRHVHDLPIVILRPFNAFGPYQSPRAVIAEMILKCLRGEVIKSTEGQQTRDFNFVENLVEGITLAAQTPAAVGQIINIGSGFEIPICDLIRKIHKLTQSKSDLQIGVIPHRPTEIWRMAAQAENAKNILGWGPKVDLDSGLAKTIDWYKKFIGVYHNSDSPLLSL